MTCDVLIIGSGLYGAVLAYTLRLQGKKTIVLERNAHIGGNIRDEWIDGINVHKYGAHIFHTSNESVWEFISKFTVFNNYVHEVLTCADGKLIHLPLTLSTFYDVFGIYKPEEINDILALENEREFYYSPTNLEEQSVNLIGRTLYEKIIKGYTEKQWGCKATELPPSIFTRLPIRNNFDNRYFSDTHQGIPMNGYSAIISRMLDGTEVIKGVDFCSEKEYWLTCSKKVIYTGMIDELLDYRFGELQYRSLRFEHQRMDIPLYQGAAVINEASVNVPYTRTIEHKHFVYDTLSPQTIVTREYPEKWQRGKDAYYPVRNKKNLNLYTKYVECLKTLYPQVELGGRLGLYQYIDMDKCIAMALKHAVDLVK